MILMGVSFPHAVCKDAKHNMAMMANTIEPGCLHITASFRKVATVRRIWVPNEVEVL
jgi:hypothetical protein